MGIQGNRATPFFKIGVAMEVNTLLVVPLEIIESNHALGKARPFKDVRTI